MKFDSNHTTGFSRARELLSANVNSADGKHWTATQDNDSDGIYLKAKTGQEMLPGDSITFTFTAKPLAVTPAPVPWEPSAWQGINLSNNGFTLVGGVPTTTVVAACNTPPVVSINPGSANVKPGCHRPFNSSATGTPAPTVLRWEVSTNGGSTWNTITGQTNSSLTFTAHKPLNGNQYRVWYHNTAGDAPSSASSLVVADYGDPVAFKLTPPAPVAKPGEAQLFTVTEYDIDGNPLPNATSAASFVIPAGLNCTQPVPVGGDLSCSATKTGNYTISASITGLSPTSPGDDQSTLSVVNSPGDVRSLSFDPGDGGVQPTDTIMGTSINPSGDVRVAALDQYGNLVAGVVVNVTYSGGDPAATLSMGGTPCASNTCQATATSGIAIFTGLSIDKDSATKYQLVADAAGAAPATQFNPSDEFTVWQQSLGDRGTIDGSGGGTDVTVTVVCDGCSKNVSVNVNNNGGQIEVLSNGTGGATFVVHSDNWAPEQALNPVPATIVSPITPSDPGSEPEVWCEGTFSDAPADLPENGGTYGASMPDGHTWCLIKQVTHIQGTVNIGTDQDPNFVQAMVVEEYSLLTGDAAACRKCT